MSDDNEICWSIFKDAITFFDRPNLGKSLQNIPDWVFELAGLRNLTIRGCQCIVSMPESLSRLMDLEEIYLFNVTSLKCLPESICNLNNLRVLDIGSCSSLTCIPPSVQNLCSLRKLSISYCSEFAFTESTVMPQSLDILILKYCGSVDTIPNKLNSLSTLCISECGDIFRLPEGMDSLTGLSLTGFHALSKIPVLPARLSDFSMLRCNNVMSLDDSFRNVTELVNLTIRGCHHLTGIPRDIGRLARLKTLIVTACNSIKELPESIGELSSLEKLDIGGSGSISRIPSSFYRCVKCNECKFSEYMEYPPPHIVKLGAENIRRFLYYHDDKAKIFMAALSKRHRLPNELWNLIYTKFMPARIHGCNALKECEDLPFILKISGRDDLLLSTRKDEIDISRLTGLPKTLYYTATTLGCFIISRNLVRLDPNSKVKYLVRDGVEVGLPVFET